MSRTKRRIRIPWAADAPVTKGLLGAVLAGMLMTPLSMTQAQDSATPPGQTVTRSQPAATGVDGTQGQAAGPRTSTPGGGAADSPSSANTGGSVQPNGDQSSRKQAGVCFELTGHCVEGSRSSAPKGSPGAAGPVKNGSERRPLNLNAPDIRTVVPADELKEPLPSDAQITETQESETVSVKGDSDAPDVPGGFGALWWAVNHPSQAWRIVAPAE